MINDYAALTLYLFATIFCAIGITAFLRATAAKKQAEIHRLVAQRFKEETAQLLARIESSDGVVMLGWGATSSQVGGMTSTQVSGRLH